MTTAYAAPLPGQMATEALTGAARGFTGLSRAFAEYRLYRATLTELRALSRRDLVDLGISAYDLKRIAREAARGR